MALLPAQSGFVVVVGSTLVVVVVVVVVVLVVVAGVKSFARHVLSVLSVSALSLGFVRTPSIIYGCQLFATRVCLSNSVPCR